MERPGSSRIPPIATTPLRRGWKEELISQSSSGTHISNASGISLGEAIRRQSAINREMETWYQPYTEMDTSNLIVAQGRRLGQTGEASGLMEFPTIEGGLLTPGVDESRRQHASNLTHTPILEAQDSRLSPNLPLSTTCSTQGRTFFNETFFRSLGMDFAPLRGTPDVSSLVHETSRPLQANETVRVTAQDVGSEVNCSSLSQHPFTLSAVTASNASPGSCLSQYPLSFSTHVPMEWRLGGAEQSSRFVAGADTLVSEDRDFRALGMQKLLNQPTAMAHPPEAPQGTIPSHDPFFLDSSVPAPLLLEMLEEEVGLSKHSSSDSSSCKSVLGKDPEDNGINRPAENTVPGQREPEVVAVPRRQDGKAVPELVSSQPFSDSEGKPFTNASLPGQLPARRVALVNKVHSTGESSLITGLLPRPLPGKQPLLQVCEAVTEESKQGHASAVACSRRNTPAPFQTPLSAELGDASSKQGNAIPLGIQTGASEKDLMLSGCSIQREHKHAGISPSFIEGSILGYLAQPINHSTPGVAPARALAQRAPSLAPLVQSAAQPLPSSLPLESSTSSHATCRVPSVEKPRGPSADDTLLSYAEEPPTLRSEEEAATGNSETLQAPPPLQSRIQSLPSLNFMEKVGVWNTSRSAEKMSDALALQSSGRASPRQKAYSAIAEPLNRILLQQQSRMKSPKGPPASFSASSAGRLHALDKKSPRPFPLTRSRSENSVVAIGEEVSRDDAGKEIEREEDFRPTGGEDAVFEAPAAKPNEAEAEDPQVQRYIALLVSTVLSDEETVESIGGESDLKRFISSERVAELLREEAACLSGGREKTDGPWGDSRVPPFARLSSSPLNMDHFSDVSPDSLNQINSSVASSCVEMRLSPRRLSVLSGELHSSLEDVSAPRSPVPKTPENREINIEERIPVYLRNLGIDQSPSSILTPFLPRGPIREIEFSPSELRTMKASTDALKPCFQASEGNSRSTVDVTQSTFDSSTVSAPAAPGSVASPDTSLPTDLLPKPSRDLVGQDAVGCHQREARAPTPCPPETLPELPAAPQPAESSQGIPAFPTSLVSAGERSTKCVQVLEDRFNPKELVIGPAKLPSASLPEKEGQTSTCEEPHFLPINSPEEEGRDSFVESKTLKEIQELLARAEARGPSRFIPVSSISSSVDQGSSSIRTKKADGCRDFRSAWENSPGHQRVWSWDESLSRQNVRKDTSLPKALSFAGNLKWEGALSRDITSNRAVAPEEPKAVSSKEMRMKSPVIPEEPVASSKEGKMGSPVVPEEPKAASQKEGQMESPVIPAEPVASSKERKMKSPVVPDEPKEGSQEEERVRSPVVPEEPKSASQKERRVKSPVVPGEPKAESQEEGRVKSPVVPVKPQTASQEEELMKSSERSEPEGCNSATGARSLPLQPVLFTSTASSDLLQTASTSEPSGSISGVLEGLQRILDKAGEASSGKGTGSVQGSENSSSLDSLGVRVKSVLRGEYPVIPAVQWGEGENLAGHRQKQGYLDPSLSFRRENASAQGSEHSSSMDSLAARVITLLDNERPMVHAAQILRRAEEDERKALMWVKRKLAAESTTSALDLSEEDRRKIEEIKTEMLLSGKKAEVQDRPRGNSYEEVPGPFQKPETGRSVVAGDSELHVGIQAHSTHIDEFPVQVRPVCGADHTLPRDSGALKPLNSIQSYTCTQLQTSADKPVDSGTGFHARSHPDRGTCLSALRSASEAHTGEESSISAEATSAAGVSPTEAPKQITSITFASRKRSPPPPASPTPPAARSEAVPHDRFCPEAKSIGSEQLVPSRQLPDALNPSVSTTSAAAYPRDNVGFPPRGDGRPLSPVRTRDKSPQRKGTLLEENPQTCGIEPKLRFVTENHEEAVVASQASPRPRGNGRPLGGGPKEKVDPGGKMAVGPLSINLPQPMTENESLLGGFSGSFGSFVHDLCRSGEADTGNGVLLPSSSLDHVSAIVPVSPSSPTRKALSGVHITLLPRRNSLDFRSPAAAEAELRQRDSSKPGSPPVTSTASRLLLETTSKSKPSQLYPQTQDSAYFPVAAASPDHLDISHLHSSKAINIALRQSQELLENRPSSSVPDQESPGVLGSGGQNQEKNLKVTVSSQTEKLSSDAITQITTESPEKTTYSAEIFVSVDDGESSAVRSSHWKSREILRIAPPALDQVSVMDRQNGKPHLLPYKPPGSSEMYYVLCPKEALRLSRIKSETTVESSHSGSNDAIPPEFPPQVLGSREESLQDAVAIKHKEGIYSKRDVPKIAWTEGKAAAQDHDQESAKPRNSLASVQAPHSVFRSAQFYLHPPMPLQHEIDFHLGSEALEQSVEAERPVPPPEDFFQHKGRSERGQPPFSLRPRTGKEKFSPLVPELDYSLIQEQTVLETCERDSPRKEAQPDARDAGHQVAKELPLPGSQRSPFKEWKGADLPYRQTVHFTDSLDELWSKYLERRRQRQDPGGHEKELSLVERLDRLARLLQNPVRHSLMPAEDELSGVREKGRRREPKKIRSPGRTQAPQSNPVSQLEESHDTTDGSRLSESRRHRRGEPKASGLPRRTLERSLNAEIASDSSSEARPGEVSYALTDISASESDAATRGESAPSTEASGSVSSIDTARLIRAFGQDRVCVSPGLSRLYSTISFQRNRSEKQAKGSRRAPGADPPKTAWPEHRRKVTQATYPVSSSDSVSTPGSSRGLGSALNYRRTTRMLNKAVQAGDFEIVNSATKRHTRDVGLTFPTPTSRQTKLQGDRWERTEDELTRPDGLLSGSKSKQRRQPSGWLAEKRTARNKPKGLQGVSWFVPAEDLKSDSKRESGPGAVPTPSWFEPLPGTKPWREPLREKNWPEDPRGLQVRLAAPARDVENEPPPPYARLSLQEALVLRRPDFISRSGERVKRLKLIMEERKLQNVLQSEREQLFNPPEERRLYRNGLVPGRGYRVIQKASPISKNEMVQRSKRIYEQLPEVRKRREEEKRKSDYSTYRLKARLYKTKITNRVLGRKVPWE